MSRGDTAGLTITGVETAVITVPTSTPEEQDGTLTWSDTTLVHVTVRAGDRAGTGFTYGPAAVASVVEDPLAGVLDGADATDVRARWLDMFAALRNAGRPGIGSLALSAVDVALWDLKGRALDASLLDLWGAGRGATPVYGSGGFTNLTLDQLAAQLCGWVDAGIARVKMKVGRHPDEDPGRVAWVRDAVGPDVDLLVDANGAYTVQQALREASVFADLGVTWLEEPVSSDDLQGLRHVRQRVPRGIDVAAGEYGFDVFHHRDLVTAGAVDCLQADVTRCGGFTGFADVAALAFAHDVGLSAHCAPNLSAHACAAAPRARHIEYFHDHVRIEDGLFDGSLTPRDGVLRPDRTRPGHGLALRPEHERTVAG